MVNRSCYLEKHLVFNPFSTNIPIMDKPGSCFLLPKCLKNTCGRPASLFKNVTLPQVFSKHFGSKNQLTGFYVTRTLFENRLI